MPDRHADQIQQDELEAEREQILKAMLGETEQAPEPGSMRVKDIIHAGDEAYPMPVIVSALKSAGYSYVYDSRTGDRSVCINYMLPAQLKKKRPDGSLVFALRPPVDAQGRPIRPPNGSLRCPLHVDERPQHPDYDTWNLPNCPKANLRSLQDVEDHMRHRHKREWQMIERDRQAREKEEDRRRQDEILLAIAGSKRG